LSKIHNVVVEIHRPTETYPGQVAEGRYTFVDGEVTLVDHVGQPVRDRDGKTYRKKLQPGEDAYRVAGRLTKQFRNARRGGKDTRFSAPIHYPKNGSIV
jgi:hypothetical protein